MNKNEFINAYELIVNGRKQLLPIRTFIVKSFIALTSHFTEGAYNDLLKSQDNVSKEQYGFYDEKKDIDNAINNLAIDVKDVISFDKIDPSLVFFHEKEGLLFSIITNKPKNDPEYISLLNLKNSQFANINKGFKELPNYNTYNQEQFLKELKEILEITIPVKKGEKEGKISLEEITGDYVITADNFVKMVLILLRIRSNIPVIMMGETGCGKTSLIRKLSEMKNEGDKTKMKILNIHAGTNDDDIIKFINEDVIPEAEAIRNSEEEKKKNFLKMGQIFEDTKLWVFLDEINTCKSMGLISELMCKHTCQGNSLPDNIVFIAACNPYRLRNENEGKDFEIIGLVIKESKPQLIHFSLKESEIILSNKPNKLVYTVNPLPHSLLNFVFYFGKLKPNDEKNYIKCIIKKAIEKIYYKGKTPKEENKEDYNIKNLKKMACDMIWEAQEYIRQNNDVSAVSLREIRRVNIFYEYFYDYLNTKKNFFLNKNQIELNDEDSEFYKNLNDYSIQIYSMNLSIFICYYLRITDKEQRIELNQKLDNIFYNLSKKLKYKKFLDLPLNEEKFIVKNIKIDKGIAINRALLENIFALFVAINSKVPIFIVGKPGCSKSLSMQLITKSMKGTASENYFFKNLPQLVIHAYQGSLASTSKGVENVFKKARNTLEQLNEEDKGKIISLIFFDEMGLAEHSPNNPLKVIHAELEYDQNEDEKKVAFVGISNWNLDASKMNRGIAISIPDPDIEDNINTAFIIGNSYNEIMAQRYKSFLENLGISYYNYKQYLKENHSKEGKADFHGNRDFYHLVKNTVRNMLDKENKNSLNDKSLLECAIDSIERNFAGIQFNEGNEIKSSLEIYKDIFRKIYTGIPAKKEYEVLKRIKENINDLNSRYLLIASESSIGTVLLSSILEIEKKEYHFYIGSPFETDLNSEEYVLKVLNKIQSHMEQGNILILKNLESVYPSLYDLFNQNFTVHGNKNYARLALGSNTNTFAYVDKEFRCIVNVEISKLDKQEAPFLNRFEKHIMSFEYMMDKELIKEAERIKRNIDSIFDCNRKTFKAINYDLKKLMINCNKEEIQALVYTANKNKIKKEDINNYVLDKIAMTLPQDILINLKINAAKQSKNLEKILEFYQKGEHSNFAKFLEKTKNQKNIVYTFSGYLEDIIEETDVINNSIFGNIKKENIEIIQLNSIKSERELEIHIDNYLNEEKLKVCIIKFLPYEGSFMNYIKYFIENKIGQNKVYENKLFIFIVYITRISLEEINNLDKKSLKEKEQFDNKILKETLSNLSGFYQIFIDNLKGDPNLKLEKIINMKTEDLIKNVLNPDEELMGNIFKVISYMKYNIINSYKGLTKDNYVNKLVDYIERNKYIRNLLNEIIFKNSFKEKDIISKIFQEKDSISDKDIEILSTIKRYLSKIYTSQLAMIFFKAEKDQFFSSLLSNEVEKENLNNEKIIEKISKSYLENIFNQNIIMKVVKNIGANKVNIFFGFKIPRIKKILGKIVNLAKENTLKDFRKNENLLLNYYEPEEVEEELKKIFYKFEKIK